MEQPKDLWIRILSYIQAYMEKKSLERLGGRPRRALKVTSEIWYTFNYTFRPAYMGWNSFRLSGSSEINACKTQSKVSSGLGAKDNHSGRKIWDDVILFDSDLLPSVPTVTLTSWPLASWVLEAWYTLIKGLQQSSFCISKVWNWSYFEILRWKPHSLVLKSYITAEHRDTSMAWYVLRTNKAANSSEQVRKLSKCPVCLGEWMRVR